MEEYDVWIPFEQKPDGTFVPRHDLPVFVDDNAVTAWMTAPENNGIHFRDGRTVLLSWSTHTFDEAKELGFDLSKIKGAH